MCLITCECRNTVVHCRATCSKVWGGKTWAWVGKSCAPHPQQEYTKRGSVLNHIQAVNTIGKVTWLIWLACDSTAVYSWQHIKGGYPRAQLHRIVISTLVSHPGLPMFFQHMQEKSGRRGRYGDVIGCGLRHGCSFIFFFSPPTRLYSCHMAKVTTAFIALACG